MAVPLMVAVTTPVVAASSAFACVTVVASVVVSVPVWLVIPANAATKLAAVPDKLAAIVAALRVIAPVVAALIATSSATVAAVPPVIVTATSASCVVAAVKPAEAVPPGAKLATVSLIPPVNTRFALVLASSATS